MLSEKPHGPSEGLSSLRILRRKQTELYLPCLQPAQRTPEVPPHQHCCGFVAAATSLGSCAGRPVGEGMGICCVCEELGIRHVCEELGIRRVRQPGW